MTDTNQFPPEFTWGVASSSYQIEGARFADGKGESIWDRFSHTPGKVLDGDHGDVACDHYNRWPDDIRMMQSLGVKAYRFSISWPRILPTGRGTVNEAGLDFYSRLVDGLLAAGITPFVTLYHWDLPQALEDEGGWPARSTAEAFVEYADAVTRRLGDRVKNWITHNEPAVVAWNGYDSGEHAPGIKDLHKAIRTSHHVLLSHGWAVPVIRRNSPGCEVGITLNINWTMAASNSRYDLQIARVNDGKWARWFADPVFGRGYPADMVDHFTGLNALPNGLDFVHPGDMDAIATPCEFIGVNYYNRSVARSGHPDNEPQTVFPAPKTPENWTAIGWENYADGLLGVLGRLHFEYQAPKIYITENGASYPDGPGPDGSVKDIHRLGYLKTHFQAMHRAIGAGVPLAGYFLWTLMDNFEWAWGYSQRFGITWVDFETQERILKDSAHWYRKVIERNGLDPD